MKLEAFLTERWLNLHEDRALYNIAETDIKSFKLQELIDICDEPEMLNQLLDIKLTYSPTPGSDGLREAIASLYKNCKAENILVTNGAMEAEFLLMNSIVNAGDRVIVQYPAYQSLHSIARARGAEIQFWEVPPTGSRTADVTKLLEMMNEDIDLVVLNTPQNPTGAVIPTSSMQLVVEKAKQHGIKLVCDEVYHGLSINAEETAHVFDLWDEAISVGSLSKSFGLSGLRLGWIAGPKELVTSSWQWKDYTTITNSPVSDYLARKALKHIKPIMERNRKIAQNNLDYITDWFTSRSDEYDFIAPNGGVLCFPKLRRITGSSEPFCISLLENTGVFIVPGDCFGFPGHVRIGFGGDLEILKIGLKKMHAHLLNF